jgi:hypothetical protein
MSIQYAQHSLQDAKFESGEEQGQSKWETALLSKMQTSKNHSTEEKSEKFKNK